MTPDTTPQPASRPHRPLPGDAAWWLFLSAEFVTLCLFFGLFAIMRANNADAFQQSQSQLNPTPAFVNALILITSGYFAARGVHAMQRGAAPACRRWLNAAGILGVVFLAIKSWEYWIKLEQGIFLSTSTFYFFYFFLTGFHYLHVWLGVGFLFWVSNRCRRGHSAELQRQAESCAAFWHMLDLVWVILFPLLYLS